ncbi:MAG TPA: hypothetical protein VNA17_07270 [Pyrinomonadaceae bacterium]|nr:hypothetical protein [Pyrinomonadaceae bacterium]
MTKINWVRFFLGGLIATVLLFLSDGLLHENVFRTYWEAVYRDLGTKPPAEGHSLDLVYFFIFEMGRGFGAMLVYVLMRPFYGAGPKTAVLAAIATWLALSVAGPAEFIPLRFYSNSLWIGVAAVQLVTSIIAAMAGAAIYKDPAVVE